MNGDKPKDEAHPHVLTAVELLRSPLIVILLNVIVAGVMTFINWAYITGKYTERFASHEKDITTLQANFKTLNEQGTYASRAELALERQQFGQFLARLNIMEPKVERITILEGDITRLQTDVKELRSAHIKP